MPLIVPDVSEVDILTNILTPALSIKLFSNNYTPVAASINASFTEVAGGGYAQKSLTFANWGISPGTPSIATYNAVQTWTFTGVTNAPATVYGYYVVRVSDGLLMWAERFSLGAVPVIPVLGTTITVTPVLTGGSVY